jgi:hypothetical protein
MSEKPVGKETYEILKILKQTYIDEGLWMKNRIRCENIQADIDLYERFNKK